MKKRILSALLAVIMIMGAMSISVSAAETSTVSANPSVNYATLASYVSGAKNGSVVYVTTNVEVTSDLLIPKTVTVVIMPGCDLFVSAKLLVEGSLVVYGTINPASQMKIQSNMGYINYNPGTGYYWDAYVNYYNTILGYQNQGVLFCQKCLKTLKQCDTCKGIHCLDCKTQHVSLYYCNLHTQLKTYCATCRDYYCNKCTTTHTHTGTTVNPYYYCTVHAQFKVFCTICNAYYCTKCTTTHTHATVPTTPVNYCTTHSQYKTYCAICGAYICDKCTTNHNHTTTVVPGYGTVVPGVNNNGYTYVPGVGWVYIDLPDDYNGQYYPGYVYNPYYYGYYGWGMYLNTCSKATASIKSGSEVESGTTVTLKSGTSGATIYYTTDGTNPTTSSAVYSEPIAITEKTSTIKAIVVKAGYNSSVLAVYDYKVVSTVNFTDIAGYEGLKDNLKVLIENGLIKDGEKFNPEDSFTYGELTELLEDMGAVISKGKVDFDEDDVLSYDDFVFATYKILKANKMVKTPKISGKTALKVIENSDDITDKAIYRAAYTSFIEHDMLCGFDFEPAEDATRAYLGYALGAIAAEILD